MNQNLEQSILQTLAYFSVANFPLTKEEVFRHLWKSRASWADLESSLNAMIISGKIGEKWGYYFLPGEEATIETRREAVVFNDQKIKQARKAVRLIAWVPFLKAVLVCNSVGREVATVDSDIDFLIITAPRRVWIVRFFTNTILRLFGLRTYGNKERNRVCLSFFTDANNLELGQVRAIPEDIHFAYWLHQMVPVFDPEGYYSKLLTANKWTDELLPRRKQNIAATENRPGFFGKIMKRFFEIAWGGAYGDIVEKQAKEMQWLKLKRSKNVNTPDNGLVIKEGIIKLHEHDARASYHAAWLVKQTHYVRQA